MEQNLEGHTHKTVDLPNGETYAYREAGNPSKPVLLMIHNSFNSSRQFLPIFPDLKDHLRLIAVDLRGHGYSSYKNPINSLTDFSEDIKLFCDALGLKKFSMLGWTFGGGLSLQFAAMYPEYVERIILHSSMSCQGYYIPKVNEKFEMLQERVKTREEAANFSVAAMLNNAIANKGEPFLTQLCKFEFYNQDKVPEDFLAQTVESYYQCRSAADTTWVLNFFNISTEDSEVAKGTKEITKITCPVLILSGEHDYVTPPNDALFNKKALGDLAELKTYKDAGNALLVEKKEEFLKDLKEFMKI